MESEQGQSQPDQAQGQLRQARDVFNDPIALDEPDDRAGYAEERWNRIGMVEGRLLVVTYTERTDGGIDDEIVRIISARPATRREWKRYHEA